MSKYIETTLWSMVLRIEYIKINNKMQSSGELNTADG